MKLIGLLFLLLIGGQTLAQKDKDVKNNGYTSFSNTWNESPRGNNGLTPRFLVPKPGKVTLDKRSSVAGVFIVKFTEGTHIRFKNDELFFDEVNAVKNTEEMARLARAGLKSNDVVSQLQSVKAILNKARSTYGFTTGSMFRTAQQPYEKDDRFIQKAELEQRAGEELADLDLYYVVYAKDFKDMAAEESLMNELSRFGIVEQVYPAVLSIGADRKVKTEPVNKFFTPDVTTMQGYLDPAPTGLDARYAWTRSGGRGDGIKVVDVEYGWVGDHEDFPTNFFLSGRAPFSPYYREGSEHGTAVMGILASPHNGFGVSGFVPNIRYGLTTAFRPDYIAGAIIATFSGENWLGRCHNFAVAISIAEATTGLSPGDVLLIEQHTPGPSTGAPCPSGFGDCSQWEYVPMEYYQECFDVIRAATAAGIIVVEAGGNGGQNLDGLLYGGRFTSRNSQAILVGASGMGNRSTAVFSNTSNRMDLHAWGGGVVSIGYGQGTGAGVSEPFSYADASRLYTYSFGGTSSASPMVAGSVASIQAIKIADGQLRLSPRGMRDLLVGTGTPQVSGGPIGPQPNLRSAIERSSGVAAFSGPGIYSIRSRSSGKMLDIDIRFFMGGYDGQNLVQYDSHLGLNQQFRIEDAGSGLFRIIALHSGKALDVWGNSLADDGEIKQYTSIGAANQQFRIVPVGRFFKIIGRNSGKILEVPAYSTTNLAQIKQHSDTGGDNQQWEFIRLR